MASCGRSGIFVTLFLFESCTHLQITSLCFTWKPGESIRKLTYVSSKACIKITSLHVHVRGWSHPNIYALVRIIHQLAQSVFSCRAVPPTLFLKLVRRSASSERTCKSCSMQHMMPFLISWMRWSRWSDKVFVSSPHQQYGVLLSYFTMSYSEQWFSSAFTVNGQLDFQRIFRRTILANWDAATAAKQGWTGQKRAATSSAPLQGSCQAIRAWPALSPPARRLEVMNAPETPFILSSIMQGETHPWRMSISGTSCG